MLYIYSSKGCPAKCTFCLNSKLHRSSHRTRSPEHVVNDIEYLIKNYSIDGVYFGDEFWHPKNEDRQKFFDLISERKLDFVWGCQTRLGTYNNDDLQQMYDAGCRWILFGIESGCKDQIINIKKGIDIDMAKDTFEICRNIGISTQGSFIIGLPNETEEELKETINFIHNLDSAVCFVTRLYLQPYSEMFETAVINGNYIPPKSLKEWEIDVGEKTNVNLSKVSDIDLKVIHYYFEWLEFSKKESLLDESYRAFKYIAIETLKKIFKYGLLNSFPLAFISVKKFFTVLWYAKAYPKTLKKYRLYRRK